MRTIAVLGAGGFIGRSLCERLSKGKSKLIFGSFTPGSFNNSPIDPVDLTRKDALDRWLDGRKIDALFYLSSLMPHRYSGRDWELVEGNLQMHRNVYDCWSRERFHLIYASGTSVYAPSQKPLREDGATMPQMFYTLSKLWGEQLFWLGFKSRDLPLSVMRISAPYGLKKENPTVVNTFFHKALQNDDLQLMGSGRREQNFIYVKDAAEGLYAALAKRKYGIFNIAGSRTVTMKQLAQAVIRATGSRSKVVLSGRPDPQESVRVKIDISKAGRELGFRPKYSLDHGLADMVRIYKRGTPSA